MKTTFLDFEQPIAELEAKIEELRFVQDDSALDISEEIARLQKKSQALTRDIYGKLDAWQIAQVARHPQRPVHARLRERHLHRVRGAARRPRVRRRSGDRRRARALRRRELRGARPPERARHEGEALPQLRDAQARRLPQGAAADEARGEIRRSALRLRRYAGRLPGRGRRRARTVRGHRAQSLRDGRAQGAGDLHRHRRGRLRRCAGDRGRAT